MYGPNLKSVALAIPEIITIGVSGGGRERLILGRGGRRELGMVPFERALVSSYRPSIVIFPVSSRISETLSLLGYEERRCWAIVRAISFQDLQPTGWAKKSKPDNFCNNVCLLPANFHNFWQIYTRGNLQPGIYS